MARESTIQILYGGSTTGAPTDLSDGELAYAHGSKNLFVGAGGNNTAVKIGAQVLDEDDFNSNSATSLASQQSIKTYVDNSIGASAGVTSIEALTGSVNVAAGLGIGISTTGSGSGTLTISGLTASSSVTGVAKYNSDDFTVSAVGNVSLANDAINFVTDDTTTKIIGLGSNTFITGSDGIETSSSGNTLTFGLSNSGIPNAKLANRSINFSGGTGGVEIDGSTSTQVVQLGSTVTIGVTAATATQVGVAAFAAADFALATDVSGYGTVNIKSGGVANNQLANSSVSFGGVSLNLGETDATPAFNLSDATGLDPSTGISGDIPSSKLNNSGFTVTTATDSGSLSIGLGQSLGFTGTANEITVEETAGKVQIGMPDNVTISGDLTVNGTVTTINTTTVLVEDSLMGLAHNNSADSIDIGFIGRYNDGAIKYTGLARDANDSGKFKLFEDISGAAYNGSDATLPSMAAGNIATLVCKVNAGTYS